MSQQMIARLVMVAGACRMAQDAREKANPPLKCPPHLGAIGRCIDEDGHGIRDSVGLHQRDAGDSSGGGESYQAQCHRLANNHPA